MIIFTIQVTELPGKKPEPHMTLNYQIMCEINLCKNVYDDN